MKYVMNVSILFYVCAALGAAAESAAKATPVKTGVIGQWTTIDDVTGKANSVVEITVEGQGLRGRILELIKPEKPVTTCEKCTGALKNQPLVGLPILQGFHSNDDGQEWSGGEIVDPKSGKTYTCRLRLKDEGRKLEVRGYIGFSLLGRSQTWLRKAVAEGPPAADPAAGAPAP